jgi:hypothetical protein
MLLVDKTFEIVTNESAEHGEVEDAGFSAIGEKYTFRELVLILKSFTFTRHNPRPIVRLMYGLPVSQNRTI